MKDLHLPDWDIPELAPKPVTADEYVAWNQAMYRIAVDCGAVERRRRDPTRCPVDSRFTLD